MRGTLLIVLAILVIGVIIVLFDANVKDTGSLPDVEAGVEVIDEGSLPEVNIEGGSLPEVDGHFDATGGRMPEVEVRGPEVDVQTETREFEVPTNIEVNTPEDTQ